MPKQKVLGHIDTTGYCVKCKAKRKLSDAPVTAMKNGRPIAKGECPKCGTTVARILSKAEAESL